MNKQQNTSFIIEDNLEMLFLESELFEIISQNKAEHHTNASEIGFNLRRLLRIGLTLPIPFVNIWTWLSEAGIVSSTEKHSFIRFQGLTKIHINRISKTTGTSFYRDELKHLQAEFSGASQSEFEDAYFDMIAKEAALVTAGYIRIDKHDKLSPNEISKMSDSIMHYKFSTTPNTGVWNRFKTIIGGFGYVGLVGAIFPIASYLGHLSNLSKTNTAGKIRERASDYLSEYLKKTN